MIILKGFFSKRPSHADLQKPILMTISGDDDDVHHLFIEKDLKIKIDAMLNY